MLAIISVIFQLNTVKRRPFQRHITKNNTIYGRRNTGQQAIACKPQYSKRNWKGKGQKNSF